MQRSLSSEDIRQLDRDYYRTVSFFRACIRRSGLHVACKRSGTDRRVAISTFIDPVMDRRSGFDRRQS